MIKRFAVMAALAVSPAAFAGSGSHGGDIRDAEAGAAWFEQKDGVIKYCLELGTDFGVSQAAAQAAAKAAFDTWKAYLTYRRVPAFYQIFGGELTRESQALPACNGTEDLTFFLGVSPPEVRAELPHYENPVAFAHRTAFQATTGWGKGFVWISGPRAVSVPGGIVDIEGKIDWTIKDALQVILTHEIGHVLGTDHVAGTIMDEDIVLHLVAAGPGPHRRPVPLLTSIDWENELLTCNDLRACEGDQVLDGKLGDTQEDTAKAVATYLLGHDPGGPVAVRGVVKQGDNLGLSLNGGIYELQLKVGDTWTPFRINRLDTVVIYRDVAFHRVTRDAVVPGGLGGGMATGTSGSTLVTVGQLTTRDGKTLHVIVKHNAGGTPLAISAQEWFLDNSYSRELFTAAPGWRP